MHWLNGLGRPPQPATTTPHSPEPVERAMPGVAALFDGVTADGSHAVLDLGAADGSSLRVYSRFARWVRFADLLTAATIPARWAAALEAVPENPETPYDIVLAWDVLDRLKPSQRAGLIDRLVELTAPGARLHLLIESSYAHPPDLVRFTLANVDRVRLAPADLPRPIHRPVLSAEVKGAIEPFRVQRAFSTRIGLREYVAVRPEEGTSEANLGGW